MILLHEIGLVWFGLLRSGWGWSTILIIVEYTNDFNQNIYDIVSPSWGLTPIDFTHVLWFPQWHWRIEAISKVSLKQHWRIWQYPHMEQ